MLAEQPMIKDGQVGEEWWSVYGGEPDVIGDDLAKVASAILAHGKR